MNLALAALFRAICRLFSGLPSVLGVANGAWAACQGLAIKASYRKPEARLSHQERIIAARAAFSTARKGRQSFEIFQGAEKEAELFQMFEESFCLAG